MKLFHVAVESGYGKEYWAVAESMADVEKAGDGHISQIRVIDEKVKIINPTEKTYNPPKNKQIN